MSIHETANKSLYSYGFTNPITGHTHMTYEKPFNERFEEVGAIWDKDKHMSMKFKEEQYVIFPNKFHADTPNSPKYRVFKAKEEPTKQ